MLVKFNYLSQKLGKQTNVTMFIPSVSFEDQMMQKPSPYKQGIKYQVLYLLHGGSGDDSDYVNFTNIVRYAQDNKIVVVMPSGYNSFYTNQPDGFISSDYFDFVNEELPLVCESYFPISLDPEDTFVAGLSMGGHGSMKLSLLDPEKFNSAYIMSGVVMDPKVMGDVDLFNPETSEEEKSKIVHENDPIYIQAKKNIEEGKKTPKLYLTTGNQDFLLPAIKKSYTMLKEFGYDIEYEEIEGYGHEWDFWDLSLKKALYDVLPLKREPIFK